MEANKQPSPAQAEFGDRSKKVYCGLNNY